MDNSISNYILAIVATDEKKVLPGGCPVILASDQEEQVKVSLLLARILGGIVHDLENGLYFICRH
ncbi:MAG: hypothetical protein GXY40_11995 [Syntrophomonadaceae bacterium]|jgi:hypothetical protein|nr:hypothetical protein [Syntrophomonadaceae bacterium]